MVETEGIRLVVFDVGGVMVRICRDWAEGCLAAGLEVRHERDRLHGLREQWEFLVRRHQTGEIEIDQYSRAVSAMLNNLYSSEEVEAVHHAWLCEPYPDVDALIRCIHRAGVSTATLSNTNRSHWDRLLSDFDVIRLVQHPLASHELGLHKPDEAVYRELERRLRRAGPEIVFFDDLEENILAARRLGWRAHQIDPLRPTAPQMRIALPAGWFTEAQD